MLITLPRKKEKGQNIPTVMPGDATVPTNPTTDTLPLILRPNAPSIFLLPYSSPRSPFLPVCPPDYSLQEKNTPKIYIYTSVKFPDPLFRFQTTTTFLTLPSHYHHLRVQFNSDSCQLHIPSHFYNCHSPLSWEITPLRSILTRSLTGC